MAMVPPLHRGCLTDYVTDDNGLMKKHQKLFLIKSAALIIGKYIFGKHDVYEFMISYYYIFILPLL